MTDDKAKMIERVRKLLALSQSTNQHEAELAAERASKLMEEYQIQFADLELNQIRTGAEPIVEEHFQVDGLKMKLHWVGQVGYACALLYDGTILVHSGLWGTSFTFVGFKSDIPMMKTLFTHLYHAWGGIVEHDLQQAKNQSYHTWAPRDTMKYKHGHGQGYAQALVRRCWEIAQQRKVKLEATSNSCTALVLVRDQAIVEWKKKKGCKPAKLNQTKGASDGFSAGYRSGQNVALGGAIEG